jgi:hypothetical protein
MSSDEPSLYDPIEAKIAWAEDRYRRYGRWILGDPEISDLLGRARAAARAAREARERTGMAALCAECEDQEGGSCCGAGLEDRYDAPLLLLNRLCGVELPESRRDPDGCWFLGEKGCLLEARQVICVDYVCEKIKRNLEPSRLRELRDEEGRELGLVFRLHGLLTGLVRERAGLENALFGICDFCDRRKVGESGPLGFRRSTDLGRLKAGLEPLIDRGILNPQRTAFLELGCADGRVNLLLSPLVRISAGIELEDWILADHRPLRAALVQDLEARGLRPFRNNVHLVLGDATDPDAHERIRKVTGLGFGDFDVFYTYLWMQREYGRMIAERAKPGAILLVYSPDRIRPRLEGLEGIPELSSEAHKLAVYRKA